MVCVICDWIRKKKRVVYETPLNVVIQPDITYNPYCLLVCPKKHYESTQDMPKFERDFLFKEAHYFGSQMEGKLGINSIRYVQNNSFWRVSLSPLSLKHVHYNLLAVFGEPYSLDPIARTTFEDKDLAGPKNEMKAILNSHRRRIYIVEGVNGCGKDSVLSRLNDRLIDTMELRTHGYYFKLSRRVRNPSEMMSYNKAKVEQQLKAIQEQDNDDFIVSRLHISDQVFSELLFGEHNDYIKVEEELDRLGATLILLDVPNRSVLLERLKNRFTERAVFNADVSPHIDKTTIWKTRNEYLARFKASKMKRKVLIDTVDLNLEEVVEEILKW